MGSAVRADDLVLDDFRPTHVVPRHGMPAWETPGSARPTVPLDPFLPVQLLERTGDWARVLCSNGWSAWVDGRLLVAVPEDPPGAARDMARATDPRPLLADAEASLGRYRAAAEDLAAGRTDGEGFRRDTAGLRLGVVVDGEAMWLYDAEGERWLYCDGRALAEYATSSTPSANPPPRDPPAHGATRAAPPGAESGGPVAGPGAEGGGAGAEGGGASTAAGHEPTRVVPVPPDGPRAAPEAMAPGAPQAHEPTRVVQAPDADASGVPDAGRRPGRPADAEPTRVVDLPGDGSGGSPASGGPNGSSGPGPASGSGGAGREGAGET